MILDLSDLNSLAAGPRLAGAGRPNHRDLHVVLHLLCAPVPEHIVPGLGQERLTTPRTASFVGRARCGACSQYLPGSWCITAAWAKTSASSWVAPSAQGPEHPGGRQDGAPDTSPCRALWAHRPQGHPLLFRHLRRDPRQERTCHPFNKAAMVSLGGLSLRRPHPPLGPPDSFPYLTASQLPLPPHLPAPPPRQELA